MEVLFTLSRLEAFPVQAVAVGATRRITLQCDNRYFQVALLSHGSIFKRLSLGKLLFLAAELLAAIPEVATRNETGNKFEPSSRIQFFDKFCQAKIT